MYSASKDGKVVVRDTRTDPAILPQLVFSAHTLSPSSSSTSSVSINCLKWAKRDCTFVTASDDGYVKFWDPVTTTK